MFRTLWNTLKDGLCCLRNEIVSMNVFPLNMHEAMDFIRSGKAHHEAQRKAILEPNLLQRHTGA